MNGLRYSPIGICEVPDACPLCKTDVEDWPSCPKCGNIVQAIEERLADNIRERQIAKDEREGET